MIKQIERLIEDQSNVESLLIQLCSADTNEQMLHIAYKLRAKREEYEWLKVKIGQLIKDNK